jgi:potassium-transporting ATPase ATP-binding subunit
VRSLSDGSGGSSAFVLGIALWLWATVLFANFAEAIAEGHGKAQAASMRKSRTQVTARRLIDRGTQQTADVPATDLRVGDLVLVRAGDVIPADGEAVEGVASVDESAVTGESAPVVRESGGDRSAVTGGTRIISDWLVVRVTTLPGQSFLDRMIAMVEGAKRQKTPNEIALAILLAALTLVFLLVVVTLRPFSAYSVETSGQGQPVSLTVLVALLVCLAPTTIGALLSAIGIAGMNRLSRSNVVAMSGRAVEAAGDVDVLLLDKTGTITLGNRQATRFVAAEGVIERDLAECAQLASLADETPEGRSILVVAKSQYGLRGRDLEQIRPHFVPFSAKTRMSGVNLDGQQIRKGAAEAVEAHVRSLGGEFPESVRRTVREIAQAGGTPLVVSRDAQVLGVIELKDIVKGGIKERFAELRRMGIKTVMITGDNPLTAAAIAAEAGVDDYLAEATPEAKLALIREYQQGGRLVAMTGDGTNDAPALAQADVAVAMNTGTQAAKEAGNMVDLDSNPTKLIEIVHVGKQLLMTRGALTTFSIANDVAKYFAILPAAFASTYPALKSLDVMGLSSPANAILAAVVFNALVIVALVPLALKGVRYRPVGAAQLLRTNLLVYGVGGLVVPFVGIKVIDLLLSLVTG